MAAKYEYAVCIGCDKVMEISCEVMQKSLHGSAGVIVQYKV